MKGSNMDSLIGYVLKQWIRNKKQILDEFGLTGPQYEILSAVYNLTNRQREIIQIDLSEKAMIDPMTTSTILRNMEKKGYIIRTRGTVNTRIVIVQLTEKGNALYNLATSKIDAVSNKLYKNIDEQNLTSQLLQLSNELNKLNN